MRKYLHDYERHLKRELGRLDAAPISAKNREVILRYYNFKFSMGISIPRLLRAVGTLRLTAQKMKKDFDVVERSDYEKFIGQLRLDGFAFPNQFYRNQSFSRFLFN